MSKFKTSSLLEYFKPAPKTSETDKKNKNINSFHKIRKRKIVPEVSDDKTSADQNVQKNPKTISMEISSTNLKNLQNVLRFERNNENKLNCELKTRDYQENVLNNSPSTRKL